MFQSVVPVVALLGIGGGQPDGLAPIPVNPGCPVAPPLVVPEHRASPLPPGVAVAAQLPCPGPTVHPFQRLPRICPAIPCECGDGNGGGGPADRVAWVKEFHEAAHFPLPRFAADGAPVCHDGLLIYEGMRLTVYQSGAYQLSFTATVPDMPVTVRLQLVLTNPTCPAGSVSREYRLTLPPFRLEPGAGHGADRPGETFHVAHRGYSSLLAAPVRPIRAVPVWTPRGSFLPPAGWDVPLVAAATVNTSWHVTRVGSARFGTPVVATDPFR